jgi:hypothetical protein
MVPVSNDTLLRVVRRRAELPADALKVVGIDDWPSVAITATELSYAIWSGGGS